MHVSSMPVMFLVLLVFDLCLCSFLDESDYDDELFVKVIRGIDSDCKRNRDCIRYCHLFRPPVGNKWRKMCHRRHKFCVCFPYLEL